MISQNPTILSYLDNVSCLGKAETSHTYTDLLDLSDDFTVWSILSRTNGPHGKNAASQFKNAYALIVSVLTRTDS